MSVISFSFFCVLVCINKIMISTTLAKLERKSGKLVLEPVELIDQLLEENLRPEMTSREKHYESKYLVAAEKFRKDNSVANNGEVDASVVPRKIWSRWSKWGECSSTCGRGAKTRHRLCLTGRCAPGEREEQHRLCCRQPCQLN